MHITDIRHALWRLCGKGYFHAKKQESLVSGVSVVRGRLEAAHWIWCACDS